MVSRVVSYKVVTIEDASTSIRGRINSASIRDYRYLGGADYSGKFSLGVYSTKDSSMRRLRDVEALNIPAEIVEETRDIITWWLNVVVSTEDDKANISQLRADGYPVQLVQTPNIGS